MEDVMNLFPRLISRGLIEATGKPGPTPKLTPFPRLISRGLIEAVMAVAIALAGSGISASDQSRPHWASERRGGGQRACRGRRRLIKKQTSAAPGALCAERQYSE